MGHGPRRSPGRLSGADRRRLATPLLSLSWARERPTRARCDAVAAGVVVPSRSSTIRPIEVQRPDHGRPGQGRCTHRIGKRKLLLIHLLRAAPIG